MAAMDECGAPPTAALHPGSSTPEPHVPDPPPPLRLRLVGLPRWRRGPWPPLLPVRASTGGGRGRPSPSLASAWASPAPLVGRSQRHQSAQADLSPLHRTGPLAHESSESVRSVRIRSTTLVRLLHGLVLLPSGISDKEYQTESKRNKTFAMIFLGPEDIYQTWRGE